MKTETLPIARDCPWNKRQIREFIKELLHDYRGFWTRVDACTLDLMVCGKAMQVAAYCRGEAVFTADQVHTFLLQMRVEFTKQTGEELP